MRIFFSVFVLFFLIFFNISHAGRPNPSDLYTVKAQDITQTLYYSGTISPIRNTPVISPTEGVIDQKYFVYGEVVKQNQVLLHIQSDKIQNDMQDARVAYLKALDDYQDKLHWNNSDEVINAQEALSRAERTLSENKNTWQENQKLYQLGIISKEDLAQSENTYDDSETAEAQAKRALSTAISKGNGDNLVMSQLALAVAQKKYELLKTQVDAKSIVSPAEGIVLEPSPMQSNHSDSAQKSTSGKIDVGSSIEYQQVLMNIGDMSGLEINFSIPEININQINPGQKITVTGAGFPGISLNGIVSEVGAQASSNGGGSLPSFPAIAMIKTLTPEQKKWIRSGMDAQIAIQVYKATKQITVPINAVTQDKNSKNTQSLDHQSLAHQSLDHQSIVQIYNKNSGEISSRVITTGKVSADSVQVLSGLSEGEQIVLPK